MGNPPERGGLAHEHSRSVLSFASSAEEAGQAFQSQQSGYQALAPLDQEVQCLQQVPMFRDIDPARLKLLAFTSERVQFAAGQRLFSQGDMADAAYLILQGGVHVTLSTPAGEMTIAELGQHALVGEMGILCGHPRSATVTAIEPTMALRMDKQIFLELLAQFPPMAMAVMRDVAERLARTNAQLAAQL